jgi:endonuclease/exonuclease/phosphatase family metal-dependent hydrolase
MRGAVTEIRSPVQLHFASYNIRKAIGVDRRRDPDRILAVLHELSADIVALQEVDRRFGRRASALPLSSLLDHTPYKPVPVAMRRESIGWHGNALLIRRDIEIIGASILKFPTIEPRGAICADVAINGRTIRVAGMHLDLSGLRRRRQVRHVLSYVEDTSPDLPAVLMGDFNQWSAGRGCMREFGDSWHVASTGKSFPSVRPVAGLDRIIASSDWRVIEAKVHHSPLATRASDHLPVKATLQLLKN